MFRPTAVPFDQAPFILFWETTRACDLACLHATYRSSPVFRTLREPDELEGCCGSCEFRKVCGGSRARAYAATGNFMAEDPACPYEPAAARAS